MLWFCAAWIELNWIIITAIFQKQFYAIKAYAYIKAYTAQTNKTQWVTMHFLYWCVLVLCLSFNVHLSLPTFWFTIASLDVRKLLWAREVRGCFDLRHGWQSLYLLLSDRILFDLQLLHVFCLWSNNLSQLIESAFTVLRLPGLLKVCKFSCLECMV